MSFQLRLRGFANLVTPPSLHRKDMTDAQTNLPGLLFFFFLMAEHSNIQHFVSVIN